MLSDCNFTDVCGFRAAVAGWTAEKSWFYSQHGRKIFSSPECPDWLWGLLSLLFNGYHNAFPRSKAAGTVADHSPLV
jgi:hypothetical protein